MDLLRGISSLDPSILIAPIICLVWLKIYQYYTGTYTLWEKRGVKGIKPLPLIKDLRELFSADRMTLLLDRSRQYGKVHGSFFFGKPCVYISDVEVMRQICIKDFENFPDHEQMNHANKIQKNFLVWLRGDHWKRVRAMMTPSFTSGKMRRMFKLMAACADDLIDHLNETIKTTKNQDGIVDLIDTYGNYTIDGITTCCYGIRLIRDKETNGRKINSRSNLLEDCLQVTNLNIFRALITRVVPKSILNFIDYEITPTKNLKPLLNRVENMIKKRREGSNKYDDLLQILVDAKLDDKLDLEDLDRVENHHAALGDESIISYQETMKSQLAKQKNVASTLTDLEILSQAAILLVVGLDTTRMSLATISYLLAHNPGIQQRLFEELSKIAKYEETQVGKHLVFDYDQLTSCQYLDAVISESLRFYTPASITDRRTLKDYTIEKYNFKIKAGERVLLGFHSMHHDPDYWSEPEKFNPDRFMPGQKENIVPGSYAPFSMGPRHCVGMRFSLMETKLGLAKVMMNFKFEPAPGTVYPPKPNRGLGLVRIKNCRVKLVAR